MNQQIALQILAAGVEKINNQSAVKIVMPSVDFDLKSSKILGTAFPSQNRVSFNEVAMQQMGDDYRVVILHELAHIVVDAFSAKYNLRCTAHGKEFKQVCRLLDIPSTATISHENLSPAKSNSVKRYEFTCACGTYYLTRKFVDSMNKNSGAFCNWCGAILSFTGNEHTRKSDASQYVKFAA